MTLRRSVARRAPSARARLLLPTSLGCVVALALFAATAAPTSAHVTRVPDLAPSDALYVSPSGSDTSSGRSPRRPLRSIQAALDRARPGTTIHLARGLYRETPHTVRDGTAAAPITIVGPETGLDEARRARAVVSGQGRIFNIGNSHYRLRGFTIDGEPGLGDAVFPTSLAQARAFKDSIQSHVVDSKLVYIGSGNDALDVHDVVIRNMLLRRAGGECVRIRNDADGITIMGSLIEWCGLYGRGDDIGSYRYHNGEGVYIGTSPKSTDQPLAGRDASRHVLVTRDVIRTYGSECVDVKEQAHDNTITGNICADDDEPAQFYGSLLELRGYGNTVAQNTISDSRGYGVKIASDNQTRYSIGGNAVRENSFVGLAAAPLRASVAPRPADLCGNRYAGSIDSELIAELIAPCS